MLILIAVTVSHELNIQLMTDDCLQNSVAETQPHAIEACNRGMPREQRKLNWCANELGRRVLFHYELLAL